MGKLLYGPKIHVEIPDRDLVNLDALLQELRGESFTLHIVGLGGAHDGNLLSLHVSLGVALSLEYFNGPDVADMLDYPFVRDRVAEIRDGRAVTIPFDFEGRFAD